MVYALLRVTIPPRPVVVTVSLFDVGEKNRERKEPRAAENMMFDKPNKRGTAVSYWIIDGGYGE